MENKYPKTMFERSKARLESILDLLATPAKAAVTNAVGSGVDAVGKVYQGAKAAKADSDALKGKAQSMGVPTDPVDALSRIPTSGITGLYDSFGDSVNRIGGTKPLKEGLGNLGVDAGFIPDTPGIGEMVGGATGLMGRAIGGQVANVMNPMANLMQGRPAFQDQLEAIRRGAESTGNFGGQVGKEGTRAAIMSNAGKLASGAMAVPSIQGVAEDVQSGNVGPQTGMKAASAALGMYGAANQPNWTPGGVLDDLFAGAGVPGAGTTAGQAAGQKFTSSEVLPYLPKEVQGKGAAAQKSVAQALSDFMNTNGSVEAEGLNAALVYDGGMSPAAAAEFIKKFAGPGGIVSSGWPLSNYGKPDYGNVRSGIRERLGGMEMDYGPMPGKWTDAYSRKMDPGYVLGKGNVTVLAGEESADKAAKAALSNGSGAISVPRFTPQQRAAAGRITNGADAGLDAARVKAGAEAWRGGDPFKGISDQSDKGFLRGLVASMVVDGGKTSAKEIAAAIKDQGGAMADAFGDGLLAQVKGILREFSK